MANVITGLLNRIFNPHLNGERYTNPAADQFLGLSSDGRQQFEVSMDFNAEEAEKQRLWNEKMWNMSNEYNSPSAQMQRLREAGLNPSMMYGQPIAEASPASGGAEASIGSGSSGALGSLISSTGDFAVLPAQVDLMRAQAEEIRSRIPLNQQRVNESVARVGDLLQSIEERAEKVRLMISQRGLTDEQKKNISFDQDMKRSYFALDAQKFGLLKDKTEAEIKKLNAEERAILARAKVTERELDELIWTYAIRRAGLEKQNLLTDAQIAVAKATEERLKKEGLRLDQVMDMDRNSQTAKQAIYDLAHSSNPIESFLGCLLMSIDYTADGILGSILK